jgi:hypothetical protein
MAESDPTHDYIIYAVEALKYCDKDQPQVSETKTKS